MKEQNNNTTSVNTSTGESDNKCASHRKTCGDNHCGGRHRLGRFVGLIALLGIGFLAGNAFSSESDWRHHGHGAGGAIDIDKVSKMAGKRLQHMLDDVDASDEQKAKATEIVKQSLTDGAPMAKQLRDSRQQFGKLLAAPTLDKAAIEKLRAEQIRGADEISKLAMQTIVDVAEVLTPEQRTKLAEKMAKRMEHRRGWMH